MEKNKNSNTSRTSEVRFPGDHLQNEKKMPTFHHPTTPPKPKQQAFQSFFILTRLTTKRINPLIFSRNADCQWVCCSQNESHKLCWEHQINVISMKYNPLKFSVLQMIFAKFLMHRWQNIRLRQKESANKTQKL